ncbi:Fbox domain containing protein [Acanthamoeba castellanii str. Neff]|uniref:Fbox domain containing protein n=1 Tax=Acanthamoeba castellanii (strain ATCC 30010 / Neff) TaxID=1257118 RepID=L8GND9_ACACF|nr:Fbox domain containing protein [Acanthamoeba castellanii str. Neff]ELR14263.1 Fbox domain containing protein [Acanthamoeba castellanii str. Neff]
MMLGEEANMPPVRCLQPQQQATTGTTNPTNLFFTHPVHLPGELAEQVLSYVGPKELVAAGGACRLWYDVTSRDKLWQPFMAQASSGRTEKHSYKELFLELLREKKRCAIRHQYATDEVSDWLNVEPVFHPSPAWPVHPNASNALTVDLGFDVDKSARALGRFLRNCTGGCFQDPEFLRWALWRYSRFMQLKADHADRFLVPTTEIEHIWQSHLLRPDVYARDMQQVLGMPEVIDHRILCTDVDQLVFEEALRETADLWQRTFGEEYCTIPATPVIRLLREGYKNLWFEPQQFNVVVAPADWTCPFSLSVEDVAKDDEWDGHFGQENGTYYGFHPPGGWYRLATKAYERFLYFCHIYDGDEVAHPTSAIQFVWHLHMFHPILYRMTRRREGTKRLTGRVLEHIPWPHEHYREANFTRINHVWQREFGIDIQEEMDDVEIGDDDV